ncbi:MAG TPA: formylmethanofuran dehydrogenase subunit C [Burkholderiaceae bacterium]|nr:formylmethanofuran dehydrogenase subunit C [Burkholderiaceae bacterium]
MSGLAFRLRAEPAFRLDLSPLTPEQLAGQSAESIARLPLTYGRRKVPVGEWFDVRGSAGPDLLIEGDGTRLDRIGADMKDGQIRIEGNAGAYLGIGMRGGRIEVSGSADAYAASGLSGGLVRISGDAGPYLGAALPGEHRGMRGGVVVVGGRVGDRAGDHMRRGLILAEGGCGDYCGSRMQGGTIATLGRCGTRPGYGMRRGTLLFAGPAPDTGPTFNDAGELALGFLVLLVRSWKELPSRFASFQRPSTRVRRWIGDLAFAGQGELIHWPG